MGASSYKGQAPFLTYLTVFKSRLGVVNIVLPLTGFAYQPGPTLSRRLKERLSQLVSLRLADPRAAPVFQYLIEKKLVSAGERKTGRYKDFSLSKTSRGWEAIDRCGAALSEVAVFQTDVWLADPAIESTIGVPTSENSDEALELCFQLNLLSKSKSTWTAAGQLTTGLRSLSPQSSDNPMLLGLEVVALLRQVIEEDGLLLRELLQHLRKTAGAITRDGVALHLAPIAESALAAAHALRVPPPVLAEGKKFVALLKRTSANRAAASRAPGVLEHRTSPRLEWLTDFGALTKHGTPKNSFEYSLTPDAVTLLELLDRDASTPHWPDDVALGYWRRSTHWANARSRLSPIDLRTALRHGYRIMQRSVGPTAIREVCLAAGVLAPHLEQSLEEFSAHLVDWAAAEQGITVSGGRYTRRPELIHMTGEVLGEG